MSAWSGGEGVLELDSYECTDQRTSSEWSFGDVAVPIKTRPIIATGKWWYQVTVQCYVPALSQPGWVTLDKFLHPSGSWISSSVKGEVGLRVCRGPSSSATPIRHLIMILHSFFQVTLDLEFSNAP